jgi:hypothetical protein
MKHQKEELSKEKLAVKAEIETLRATIAAEKKAKSGLDVLQAQLEAAQRQYAIQIAEINSQKEELSKEKKAIKVEMETLRATADDVRAAREQLVQEKAQTERESDKDRAPEWVETHSVPPWLETTTVAAPQYIETTSGYTVPRFFIDLMSEDSTFNSSDTCIGKTLKAMRCRNPMANRQAASKILEQMRSGGSEEEYSREKLEELADWMLCNRWHRYRLPQGRQIAQHWYKELQKASPGSQKVQRDRTALNSMQYTPAIVKQNYQTPESSGSSSFSRSGQSSSNGSTSPWSPPSSISSVGTVPASLFGGVPANLAPKFLEIAQGRK